MGLFIMFSGLFLATLALGKLLERFRVPWIFSALLLGAVYAAFGAPFDDITGSEVFALFGDLGMYLLLFLVGLEIDLGKLRDHGKFIVSSSIVIILSEAILGTFVIHQLFGAAWSVSMIVALSFATVGEAILVPILHEFGMVNTALGQAIIGIGTVDDVLELLMLIVASVLVGEASDGVFVQVFLVLGVLTLLTAGLRRLREGGNRFRFRGIETMFLFVIAVFFLFVGVGEYANAGPLAALIAGMALRLFTPENRLSLLNSDLKTVAYGLFVPVFFFGVGAKLDVGYLAAAPVAVVVVVLVSAVAKVLASVFTARKDFGTRGSILLGIGLSVRFSTGIVIVAFLYSHDFIGSGLYSAMIASSIAFQFIVPVLFSRLIVRWGFASAGSDLDAPII